jgi:protocatechuate 3,4-dioxygenase beta subunit
MSHEPTDTQAPHSLGRREALGAFGALSAAPLVALAGPADAEALWADQFDAFDFAAARSCALIPQETAGPYPLLEVLQDKKMVRRDVTEGRPGVPLTLTLKLVDVNAACAPVTHAAVYIWCTDKDGVYSGYVQPGGIDTRGQTFMRGIQLSNDKGAVRFTAIYPGWYPGRITHIHFQVYLNADTGGQATATSQLAFPQKVTKAVYDSPLYAARGQNTTVPDFDHDSVFHDGVKLQLCKMKGSVDAGYAAKLLVGIAA